VSDETVAVPRKTWTRVLLDLFRRDKEIQELKERVDGQFRQIMRQADTIEALAAEINRLRSTQIIFDEDATRLQGREDVLKILREFGYSEPPRLSGRGLAAMLENRMRRDDDIWTAGKSHLIDGWVSYPETVHDFS
jgi:hypothetical protein